ncbi:MAG TPA: hypothetical protein VJP77_04470, partial [Planctomycetota bacterium]|nr:hypothetical protein [Planctomycetota bacterium]
MRIEEALDLFVVQLRADGRSSHTVEQYRRHVLLLARWVRGEGKTPSGRVPRARVRSLGRVENLRHEDLARFLVSPAARQRPDGTEKKATSTNALRTSLRCFFAYLSDAGIIEQNPARLIRRAKCASPPPRAMSKGEQQELLAAMAAASGPGAERDHMLFALMLATGLRLGSAVAVERRDVDLERG